LTGDLNIFRQKHTATLLPDGRVLVAGGISIYNGVHATVELYDPAARTWSFGSNLHAARFDHTATLLPEEKVLVAAGWNLNTELTSAEL